METNHQLYNDSLKLNIPVVFIGSKDKISIPITNGGYIFNMQDDEDHKGNKLNGTHWICAYVEGKNIAYMDSFGLPPPSNIALYFRNKRMLTLNKQIQSTKSGHCGSYCLSFLHFMSHNKLPFLQRFHRWVNFFSDNPVENLTILQKYMHKIKHAISN
jgi:hypothetical protein